MASPRPYPIGIPGVAWGAAEKAAWLSRQRIKRSYDEVLQGIEALAPNFERIRYGEIAAGTRRLPLMAVRSRPWDPARPLALVTGGVHGYETSGVAGALRFLERDAARYQERWNLLVAPCVSPWAYEIVHRWNALAVDPNRSFREPSPAPEAAALMRLVKPWREAVLVHVDLHETTDSDESEFRPALAARDGVLHEPEAIPDGFYLVDDEAAPQPEFQQAIIDAVARITHIAPADERGQIIGSPVVAPGVIRYPFASLGLCAGMTSARYKTTTEVYPDSPRTTPEQCIAAQVAAVCAALDFVAARPRTAGR